MESTKRANAPADQIIFLLGKRDAPSDGVQDYCEYLGQALDRRGIHSESAHLDWDSEGWVRSLRKLRNASAGWRGRWVILQYTALAWSRRGFPIGAAAALAVVKRSGARCAVVYHEPFGLSGPRPIDRARAACQNWIVRRLHDQSEISFFPTPLDTVKWLPRGDAKAIFIPIGANIPEEAFSPPPSASGDTTAKTIAIYCLSDPPNRQSELADISEAAKILVSNGVNLRIVFLGRGTAEASDEISHAFEGVRARVSNLGMQPANDVRNTLASSDVMLCVRGPLYPRRGSALAGIACGLPIVAYGGEAEGTPIAEAGVELVPNGDRKALGAALHRILADRILWQNLREKSLLAHRRYFSWDSIAEKFDAALRGTETGG